MRIFNQDKTLELSHEVIDYDKGQLKRDKLVIAHHEATPPINGKTAQEVADELTAQGVKIEIGFDGVPYRIVKEYESGGNDTEEITAIPSIPAQDAYDEYEDIKVYVPYTAEELKERLRNKRTLLLNAFDKWEKAVLRGREQDDYLIMVWYRNLLDLQDIAFIEVPERIKYYL